MKITKGKEYKRKDNGKIAIVDKVDYKFIGRIYVTFKNARMCEKQNFWKKYEN